MEFHEVWKEQKIPNKILASRSATGSIIWDFCKDFFPARKPLLITNDNINACAPLPSRAPTPTLPFARTCSGFQSRRLKQKQVLKWTWGEKAKSTGSTGQSFGVCKDFASRWPTFTYAWIFENRVSKKIQLILPLVHTNPSKFFGGSTQKHLERFVWAYQSKTALISQR